MGILVYGSEAIPMDDRTLAHVKVAVVTKLRRGESFTLSWQDPENRGCRRTTIWMHPSIPLRFEFAELDPPALNREWIETLMQSANTTGGILLTPEHMGVGAGVGELEELRPTA